MCAPSDKCLILVPTEKERGALVGQLGELDDSVVVELCGFGPVAAAATSARQIARHSPRQILLCGIAGSFYAEKLPVGEAACFEQVLCHGIGVGDDLSFLGSGELDIPQWTGPAESDGSKSTGRAAPVYDRLSLQRVDPSVCGGLLLTVCAASKDEQQAAVRRDLYPEAMAEDMEAFGVALACRQSRLPLSVVRGISNRVGDRQKANWDIPGAMESAARLVLRLLSEKSNS